MPEEFISIDLIGLFVQSLIFVIVLTLILIVVLSGYIFNKMPKELPSFRISLFVQIGRKI